MEAADKKFSLTLDHATPGSPQPVRARSHLRAREKKTQPTKRKGREQIETHQNRQTRHIYVEFLEMYQEMKGREKVKVAIVVGEGGGNGGDRVGDGGCVGSYGVGGGAMGWARGAGGG